MEQQIAEGDRVEVEIVNDCPLGGDTQMASFTVEEVHINKVVGTDKTWGAECVIEGFGTDTLTYSDGGKSGDVAEVRVMETTDDGVTVHGTGKVVA